ncbi:MAG TPA: DUF1761 domain-containing protein [Acidimicrobiia bacterium]|jgi:hypothetical protein
MSFATLGELNWLAVVVATVVYYGLGALWYSRGVFGDRWAKSIGWNAAEATPPASAAFYILPFFGYLLIAIAIAMLAVATGSDTFVEGLTLGLVLGVLFAGSIFFTTAKFEPTKPEPMNWFLISGGYAAVGIVMAAIILSVWR